MFDTLSTGLVDLLVLIINLFPASPFSAAIQGLKNGPVAEWMGMINWFVPVGAMLQVFTVWLSAVLVYYIYQLVLRWIKAVE